MAALFLLSAIQMRRIEGCFPLSHGSARVDDRGIDSAIVFVIKNGLRRRDAPREYGPYKTICNRFVRWSRLGVLMMPSSIGNATRSKTSSDGSKTRAASRPDTTASLTPTSRQSASPPPFSFGSDR
jgi:transposase